MGDGATGIAPNQCNNDGADRTGPGSRTLPPARGGSAAAVRADRDECGRGGGDLRAPRWLAAGDRTGGGTGEDPAARCAPRPPATATAAPDRRGARPPRAPAVDARDDWLELRVAGG